MSSAHAHSVRTSLVETPSISRAYLLSDALARPWTAWVPACSLLGVLVVCIYWRLGLKLVHDWLTISDYSHGPLIPFFFLFLLWDKREQLLATPVRQCWPGIALVVASLGLLLVGVFGADLFLARTSFLVLSAGLLLTLTGPSMLRAWTFILFVLALAIPLPALILNHITFPLQLFASQVASELLPIAGVPVLREGNVINLPAMPLEVAEACSGIRSLVSLFAVAVIYGYLLEKRTVIRVLLAAASLPIAVIANVARIFGTGLLVQYWDPVKAMGFFHEFSGWLLFLVSLASLYFAHQVLLLLFRKRKVAAL